MFFATIRRMLFVILAGGMMYACQMYGTAYGGSNGGGGGGTVKGSGYDGTNMAGIAVSGFAFSPSSVTFPASKNVTVTWTNYDGVTHTVTSDMGSPLVFDSGNVASNGTFSLAVPTSTAPGTYAYHCSIHTSMHGSITVN